MKNYVPYVSKPFQSQHQEVLEGWQADPFRRKAWVILQGQILKAPTTYLKQTKKSKLCIYKIKYMQTWLSMNSKEIFC